MVDSSVNSPRRMLSLSRERAFVSILDDEKDGKGGLSNKQGANTSEVYGFVGSISTIVAIGLFFLWAFLPEPWLHYLGITYYPSRYWALAIPTYAMVTIIFIVLFYLSLNCMATVPASSCNSLFDEEEGTQQQHESYNSDMEQYSLRFKGRNRKKKCVLSDAEDQEPVREWFGKLQERRRRRATCNNKHPLMRRLQRVAKFHDRLISLTHATPPKRIKPCPIGWVLGCQNLHQHLDKKVKTQNKWLWEAKAIHDAARLCAENLCIMKRRKYNELQQQITMVQKGLPEGIPISKDLTENEEEAIWAFMSLKDTRGLGMDTTELGFAKVVTMEEP